jgi:hypothetical protein
MARQTVNEKIRLAKLNQPFPVYDYKCIADIRQRMSDAERMDRLVEKAGLIASMLAMFAVIYGVAILSRL